jgi:hypothetical protein
MTNNLKLELKTINTQTGIVEFSHHFHFNTDENKILALNIGNHEYHLTHDGKLMNTGIEHSVI